MSRNKDVPPPPKPGAWAAACRVLGLVMASVSRATPIAAVHPTAKAREEVERFAGPVDTVVQGWQNGR